MRCQDTRHSLKLFLISIAAFALIGCGGPLDELLGGGSDDSKKKNGDGDGGTEVPDSAELGSFTWTEEGDVVLSAQFFSTTFQPEMYVYAGDGTDYLEIDVFAADDTEEWADTYPINERLLGYSRLKYTTDEFICTGYDGSITISEFTPAGDPLEGTMEVTVWAPTVNENCPELPISGSFSIVREEDDNFGNDGTETDFLTATRTGGDSLFPAGESTYAEDDEWRYVPLLTAQLETSELAWIRVFAEVGEWIDLLGYARDIVLIIRGPLEVGDYDVQEPTGNASQFYEKSTIDPPNTGHNCQAAEGTITLTEVGGVGGQISGTYYVYDMYDEVEESGCPTEYSGTFSVTVEDFSSQ